MSLKFLLLSTGGVSFLFINHFQFDHNLDRGPVLLSAACGLTLRMLPANFLSSVRDGTYKLC